MVISSPSPPPEELLLLLLEELLLEELPELEDFPPEDLSLLVSGLLDELDMFPTGSKFRLHAVNVKIAANETHNKSFLFILNSYLFFNLLV